MSSDSMSFWQRNHSTADINLVGKQRQWSFVCRNIDCMYICSPLTSVIEQNLDKHVGLLSHFINDRAFHWFELCAWVAKQDCGQLWLSIVDKSNTVCVLMIVEVI